MTMRPALLRSLERRHSEPADCRRKTSAPEANHPRFGDERECYGMLHYLEQTKDRTRMRHDLRDSVSTHPRDSRPSRNQKYTWVLNPQSASSYVRFLVLRVAEYFPSVGGLGRGLNTAAVPTIICDPTIGIPTVLPPAAWCQPRTTIAMTPRHLWIR